MEDALSEPVFDRDAILTLVEGDIDFLSEIVQLFFDDYPGMLADIRESVVRSDSTALESAAHALKGAVGNFGAKHAHAAALDLEVLGRNGILTEAQDAYTKLDNEIDRLQRALATFREELVPQG